MAKPARYTDGDVLWTSKLFPKLMFTSVMLDVFKIAYPHVGKFMPELERAEAWLLTHPDRQPLRNWGAFINNWMRNANTFNQERSRGPASSEDAEHKRSQYDRSFTRANGGAPLSLKDIMQRVAPMLKEEKNEKEQSECGSQPTVTTPAGTAAKTTATSNQTTADI